jgi:hypothetical protein
MTGLYSLFEKFAAGQLQPLKSIEFYFQNCTAFSCFVIVADGNIFQILMKSNEKLFGPVW